jgi:hypothetical protein
MTIQEATAMPTSRIGRRGRFMADFRKGQARELSRAPSGLAEKSAIWVTSFRWGKKSSNAATFAPTA